MNIITNLKLTAVALTALTLTSFTDGKTRGIGVYPGNPAESYAPSLRTDNAYRNVALHRIVRTASQHDLNLTPPTHHSFSWQQPTAACCRTASARAASTATNTPT